MSTPDRQLRTLFVLSDQGRILATREPQGTPGPLFWIARGASGCAWAIRADVPTRHAQAIAELARTEPASTDYRAEPVHARDYARLILEACASLPAGPAELEPRLGPAFHFPPSVPPTSAPLPSVPPAGLEPPPGDGELVRIDDERLLGPHFESWAPGEIAAGRVPVVAIVAEGCPVSLCYCARRGRRAAEAGVETAPEHRGRGFAVRAVIAWATAVRDAGLEPLYSTWWENGASLGVARRLGLEPYASNWSLSAPVS